MVLLFIKKEIMLNVLCANYSVLLLLPRFIIFTARWLKPNLNKQLLAVYLHMNQLIHSLFHPLNLFCPVSPLLARDTASYLVSLEILLSSLNYPSTTYSVTSSQDHYLCFRVAVSTPFPRQTSWFQLLPSLIYMVFLVTQLVFVL